MPKEGQKRRPGPTGNELGRAITRLLPTPTASYDKRGAQMRGKNAQGGAHLEEALALLPTPRQRDWKGDGYPDGLPNVLKLLPTPVEGDSTNSRSSTAPPRAEGSKFQPGTTLSDVAYQWSGGLTARQSDDGKTSAALRLSPWFVEWMIGAPPGWSDPDCPLSATEFASRSDASPASTSSGSSELDSSERRPDHG